MNSISLYVTRSLLLTCGLLATGIAVTILFVPDAFYSGYGIDIGSDASLANELKAPAGLLLIAGLVMLAGVFKVKFAVPSLAMATMIYLSYGLSRLLSMAIDGIPHSGLVSAAALEIALGAVCFVELMRRRKTGLAGRDSAGGVRNTTSEQQSV